ncbi:MAG TPA: hypothetical protein VI913_04480 [Candidatus Peribacteraceae bacterium]|nr:hypothetical protein [Candidatus Peribacteraceae bacterium]
MVAANIRPVDLFVIVTLAPTTTAPLASFRVPPMAPPVSWPKSDPLVNDKNDKIVTSTARHTNFRTAKHSVRMEFIPPQIALTAGAILTEY